MAVFAWVRRALNGQKRRWFPARAVELLLYGLHIRLRLRAAARAASEACRWSEHILVDALCLLKLLRDKRLHRPIVTRGHAPRQAAEALLKSGGDTIKQAASLSRLVGLARGEVPLAPAPQTLADRHLLPEGGPLKPFGQQRSDNQRSDIHCLINGLTYTACLTKRLTCTVPARCTRSVSGS